MIFPLPRYIKIMPEGIDKERAKDRFYLKLACVYASRTGTMQILAGMLGANYSTLRSQMRGSDHHPVSWDTFRSVERLLGPDFTPPE